MSKALATTSKAQIKHVVGCNCHTTCPHCARSGYQHRECSLCAERFAECAFVEDFPDHCRWCVLRAARKLEQSP